MEIILCLSFLPVNPHRAHPQPSFCIHYCFKKTWCWEIATKQGLIIGQKAKLYPSCSLSNQIPHPLGTDIWLKRDSHHRWLPPPGPSPSGTLWRLAHMGPGGSGQSGGNQCSSASASLEPHTARSSPELPEVFLTLSGCQLKGPNGPGTSGDVAIQVRRLICKRTIQQFKATVTAPLPLNNTSMPQALWKMLHWRIWFSLCFEKIQFFF